MVVILGFGCCKDNTTEFQPPTTVLHSGIPYYLQAYYKVPSDNPSTKEGIELGRMLFFEKELSLGHNLACAGCHRPENAFSDTVNKSVGTSGQIGKRNAPSLYNVGLFRKLFWDGRDTSLEQQSLHPIQDILEMELTLEEAEKRIQSIPKYAPLFGKAFGKTKVTSVLIAKALAQFERSLVSYGSKYDRSELGLYTPTDQEKRGMDLFFQHPFPTGGISIRKRGANCGDCHLKMTLLGNPEGFDGFHNNGLESSFSDGQDIGLQMVTGKGSDVGKFKMPNLRNIALTAPYMHDGRFKTLEQVLDHYNHPDLFARSNVDPFILLGTNTAGGTSLGLTDEEKAAVIAFLHMLTDSSATRPY